jgi:hypothetical protein
MSQLRAPRVPPPLPLGSAPAPCVHTHGTAGPMRHQSRSSQPNAREHRNQRRYAESQGPPSNAVSRRAIPTANPRIPPNRFCGEAPTSHPHSVWVRVNARHGIVRRLGGDLPSWRGCLACRVGAVRFELSYQKRYQNGIQGGTLAKSERLVRTYESRCGHSMAARRRSPPSGAPTQGGRLPCGGPAQTADV